MTCFKKRSRPNQDFYGGGGVILPSEIAELQAYGITRIYAPDDGRHGIARYD
jgi:methylmalonyl-CoA mutase cobalamin-binding subunit